MRCSRFTCKLTGIPVSFRVSAVWRDRYGWPPWDCKGLPKDPFCRDTFGLRLAAPVVFGAVEGAAGADLTEAFSSSVSVSVRGRGGSGMAQERRRGNPMDCPHSSSLCALHEICRHERPRTSLYRTPCQRHGNALQSLTTQCIRLSFQVGRHSQQTHCLKRTRIGEIRYEPRSTTRLNHNE